MRIESSEAAKCRYGEDAVKAFAGAEVLWEKAENDWEARDLTAEQIQAEMLAKAAFSPDALSLMAWLDMTDMSGAYFRPKRAEVEQALSVV